MISCVICSSNKNLLDNVSESIRQSIGLPFEIIGVDNSTGRYSICQAYNEGAAKATFDILCFLHDDVLFETQNWGPILKEHFAKLENVGIIGIAGSNYKSLPPSGWWAHADTYLSCHFLQSYKYSNRQTVLRSVNGDAIRKLICLDGVFLAVKKDVFEKYRFDVSIPLFHGYDLDLSLAVSAGFQNYFIPDILLHHLSEGKSDDSWIENMFLLFKKWNKSLPMMVEGKADRKMESYIWQDYCRLVLTSTIPLGRGLRILFSIMWTISRRNRSFVPFYGLLRSMLYVMLKKIGIVKEPHPQAR